MATRYGLSSLNVVGLVDNLDSEAKTGQSCGARIYAYEDCGGFIDLRLVISDDGYAETKTSEFCGCLPGKVSPWHEDYVSA
jgi:hypothetical protein